MVKVAFASSDRQHVDQHFGAARAFAVYAVDAHSSVLSEVAEFLESAMDGNEGKLAAKIALLGECVAVYCQAVGASAIQQLLAQGIQPIKVTDGMPIESLIAMLQEELRAGPTGWLAKAIQRRQRGATSRFAAMEAEGWQE
jgi:nitrogen fixation protein NifX